MRRLAVADGRIIDRNNCEFGGAWGTWSARARCAVGLQECCDGRAKQGASLRFVPARDASLSGGQRPR
jgi:hypothetical protein